MSIQMQYKQEFQMHFPPTTLTELIHNWHHSYLHIANFLLNINISFHLNLFLFIQKM